MRKPLLISVIVICALGLIVNLGKIVFGSLEIGVLGLIILAMLPYLLLATLSYWTNSLWITILAGVTLLSLDLAQHLYVFCYSTESLAGLLFVVTPLYFLAICAGMFLVPGLIIKTIKVIKTKKLIDKNSNITIKKIFLFFVLPLLGMFLLASIAFLLFNYGFLTEKPIHKAIDNGNVQELKLLISKGANIETLSYASQTPLEAAITINSTEMITTLIKAGAKINYLNPKLDKTPLMSAVDFDSKKATRILLQAGADVNIRSKDRKETAIMFAKDKEIIDMLLKHGANINDKNDVEQTSIYNAISENNPDWIKLLINSGSDLDTKDHWGNTPLHDSARFGIVDITKLLLNNGANKTIKNNNGETAEELARQKGYIEVADMIKNY